MAFRKISSLLLSLLVSPPLWADTLRINPNHPDQYTVVKGDTLWDISGQFLDNPWHWPELWDNNPQIKNPHLIYPGDILSFSIVDGKARLSLSRNVRLSPKMREISVKDAIKVIPADAIAQFLTSPKVVNETELENSPYVVAIAGEHIVAGAGDRVYVRSIIDPHSLSYTIYRQGETYVNPETNEILGYEAKYIADATIEKAGDPATLSIIKSSGEVLKGDRLIINSSGELSLNFIPHPPEKIITGNIISVLEGVSQISRYNIVVIDKGKVDGLQSGHTLDIFQRGAIVDDPFSHKTGDAVKLPDEMAGILMVFRVFERVSYALVLEATGPLHILDKVKTSY